MKHTLDELLGVVYRYSPRGVGIVDGDLDMAEDLAHSPGAR